MKNELYHHGVKGQKWGVRRWQNPDGSLTAAGKARLKGWKGDQDIGRDLAKYTSPGWEDTKAIFKHSLVRALTQYIPGGNILLFAKYMIDVNKYEYDGSTDYTKKEGQYEKLSQLKKKSSSTTPEQDVKLTNPRIGEQAGKVNNCTLCTAAMELRNRGYDVIARSKGSGNISQIYSKWFKGAKLEKVPCARQPRELRRSWANRAYDNLCKEIEKQGPGASGYVGIQYEKTNSGHAMWYKVGNDGKVIFYDGQNGKYGVNTDKTFAVADPSKHEYTRLDNCQLDPSVTESVRSNPKEEKK